VLDLNASSAITSEFYETDYDGFEEKHCWETREEYPNLCYPTWINTPPRVLSQEGHLSGMFRNAHLQSLLNFHTSIRKKQRLY